MHLSKVHSNEAHMKDNSVVTMRDCLCLLGQAHTRLAVFIDCQINVRVKYDKKNECPSSR